METILSPTLCWLIVQQTLLLRAITMIGYVRESTSLPQIKRLTQVPLIRWYILLISLSILLLNLLEKLNRKCSCPWLVCYSTLMFFFFFCVCLCVCSVLETERSSKEILYSLLLWSHCWSWSSNYQHFTWSPWDRRQDTTHRGYFQVC